MAGISPALEQKRIDVIVVNDITFGVRAIEKSDRLPAVKRIDLKEANATTHPNVCIFFSFIFISIYLPEKYAILSIELEQSLHNDLLFVNNNEI